MKMHEVVDRMLDTSDYLEALQEIKALRKDVEELRSAQLAQA